VAGAFDPLVSLSRDEHDAAEREQRRIHRRVLGFRIVTAVAFITLSVKLWQMQIVQTEKYVTQAVQNSVRSRGVPALRGVIYDRNHVQLVSNQASFDVQVDPRDLPAQQEDEVLGRLAALVKLDPAKMKAAVDKQRLADPNQGVTVATSIAWNTLLSIKADRAVLPGVVPLPTTIRGYKDGPTLSNILGYVTSISPGQYQQLKQAGYAPTDKIGAAGVESSYEKALRGTSGSQQVEVDAGGRQVQVLSEVAPQPGKSLQLSIDAAFQQDVTSYLREGLDRAHCYQASGFKEAVFTTHCSAQAKAQAARPKVDGGYGDEGAAVVIDVHTGAILAMAAFPQYDNNVFSGRAADQAKAAAVLTSHADPLIDRALSAVAPGSTFKMITASAALQDHLVTPSTEISVPAAWPGISFSNWDEKAYANMTVVDAIAQSNDIWMGDMVAGGIGGIRGLGPDRLAWYAHQFGLGQPLGLDLPFEQKGLIPTTTWKAANFSGDNARWYTGDSLNMAIGQGFVSATTLQMADVAAAIANGGNLMQPRVGKAFLNSNGTLLQALPPVVLRRVPVDPSVIHTVASGMRKGVYTGSSYKTNLRDLQVAGKTGTAEFQAGGGRLGLEAWWAGYAPYNNPQIAVGVWIHDAGEGADFAVPVARQILARYFHVSDMRLQYGCDTPATTPAACASSVLWQKTSGYYPDQHEEPSDKHDPRFPA